MMTTTAANSNFRDFDQKLADFVGVAKSCMTHEIANALHNIPCDVLANPYFRKALTRADPNAPNSIMAEQVRRNRLNFHFYSGYPS